MAESTARWGILGTGGIARQFTRDLLLTGHTVTAVGSRTRESAERFAALFELPAAHSSYESLVADPSVDLVYVATPHPFHYPNARLALEAGKHVLVEKPFTLNAVQAQQLVSLAADRGLLVLEAMWTRWLPHMARLREIVAAGTIGEVRSMSADHTQRLPDDPGHRLNALELGGGALLDLGVYPVSFASQLFGPPQSIQATATFKETGADAQVATMFRYAGRADRDDVLREHHAGTERRRRARLGRPHRDRQRVVHGERAARLRRRRHADRGRPAASRGPGHAVPGGGGRAPGQRGPDRRAMSSRRRRRSRSWRPSTRSASRSACATRASNRLISRYIRARGPEWPRRFKRQAPH